MNKELIKLAVIGLALGCAVTSCACSKEETKQSNESSSSGKTGCKDNNEPKSSYSGKTDSKDNNESKSSYSGQHGDNGNK